MIGPGFRFMRFLRLLAFTAGASLATTSIAWADVQLTIQNGRVTLVAKDATLRQILAEWAKVGQTKIVNGERVPGGPVTIQLADVTEEQALSVLLRAISGYVAAPRPTTVANASRFDRIIVMPAAAPAGVVAPATPAPAAVTQPAPGPPFGPSPFSDDDAVEQAGPNGQPNRPPVFGTFPQPQLVLPQQGGVPMPYGQAAPSQGPLILPQTGNAPPATAPPTTAPNTRYPGAPTGGTGGVSVPGMIPASPQPGQPDPQNTPPRRPDGP